MNPHADWQGTACLLRAGFRASMAGHAGAVLAGMGMMHRGVDPAILLGLGAWGYLVYLQVRVSLDAELFGWLANGGTPAELDGFLVRAGLRSGQPERSAEDRCRGAIRLWKKLMAVLAVELVAVAIGLR